MTKEQLAELLDGRMYGSETTKEERAAARESGLVVVFGASDDLMEFCGAIYDEVDCYEGGAAYLDESPGFINGLFESKCHDDDCPYAEKERMNCRTIKAIWCPPGGGSWAYETEIPHATFNIYEDGELYCVGIVFDIASHEGGNNNAE